MAVTAKQLSKSGARGKDLDAIVREHLQIIDDKLLRADRTWGRNIVTHDLPTSLALPGLDKKDAQRILYSTILRSLERRGFETRIVLDPESTTIFIAWNTVLNTEELSAMNALIRTKRIERSQLDQFIQHVSSSDSRMPSRTLQQASDWRSSAPAPGRAGASEHLSVDTSAEREILTGMVKQAPVEGSHHK